MYSAYAFYIEVKKMMNNAHQLINKNDNFLLIFPHIFHSTWRSSEDTDQCDVKRVKFLPPWSIICVYWSEFHVWHTATHETV